MATATPLAAPTARTASSMSASSPATSLTPEASSVARSPPRMEAPSRVPRAISAVTCRAQPLPSSHGPLTRSVMYEARLPVRPRTARSDSPTASDRTGPNGA